MDERRRLALHRSSPKADDWYREKGVIVLRGPCFVNGRALQKNSLTSSLHIVIATSF
jgi:hypothetical protein